MSLDAGKPSFLLMEVSNMKKWTSLAVAVALVFAAWTYAGAPCSKTAQVAADKSLNQEAVGKIMAALPKMTYKVGEFETCCLKTATAKAGEESTVEYVVDGKSYGCRAEATAVLASLLEQEAETMMAVQYAVGDKSVHCPMAAKSLAKANGGKIAYRLAGMDFDSKDQADAAAEAVREAVAKLAGGSETASADKPGCKPGCGAKAETVAGKSGCGPDCTKPCCAGKIATAKMAADKPGCKPGCGSKAATAAGKPGCDKPCGAKAATVAAKSGCGPDCTKPCCAGKIAAAKMTADKPGCKPGCGAVAATAAGKPGCDKPCGAKAATVAAKDGCGPDCTKPCCAGKIAAAKTIADKPGCKPGCGSQAATVAGKPGCSKSCALANTAAGANCWTEAEQRLTSVKDKIRVIVETGAQVQAS